MPCFVNTRSFRGRQCVQIGNGELTLGVMTGGGHIAFVRATGDEGGGGGDDDAGSPLWQPPWPTCDPAASAAADPSVFGDGLEGRHLLSHIMGHNLCLDVFGAHSKAGLGRICGDLRA